MKYRFFAEAGVNGQPLVDLAVQDENGAQVWKGRANLETGEGLEELPGRLGLDLGEVQHQAQEALTGAADAQGNKGKAQEQEQGKARPSQAAILVELASDVELFHTPEKEPFGSLPVDGHVETVALRSRAFRRWLAAEFYGQYGKVPGSQAMQDAIGCLEGKALFGSESEEEPTFCRLAEGGGTIWLDLADGNWRAVKITCSGWKVETRAGVHFRRPRGMLSLPMPETGGSVKDLRDFVNVADDDDWRLVVAWLVQALRPRGPYPTLLLHGAQGSAKSTTARVLRSLVDPSSAPLRSEPRDPRDLMIAATNGWVVAFDNLSRLPQWLSDALCRLSTGGGFSTRELYTDAEETIFDATRPVILTGIEELATRGDLADRAISVYLPEIDQTKRRREEVFWREFEEARPRILGALLDVVAAAMRELPTVELDELPRMADFAAWVSAAEPALGWQKGTFLQSYASNVRAANDVTLEASLVGLALITWMKAREEKKVSEEWQGTFKALLAELTEYAPVGQNAKHFDWPRGPRALSGELRRLAPNLARVGLNVTFPEENRRQGKNGARTITIRRREQEQDSETPSESSAPSVNDEDPLPL
jgi:hypothetical protein